MWQTHSSRALRRALGLTAILAVLLLGCGRPAGPQRAAVSGTVTLEGKPIPEGTIAFHPTGDSKGPTAGGEIRDGAYSLPARQGPVVGTCRVEIRATRKTGQKVTFGVKEADVVDQYLPAKYNQQSKLTVDVTADGQNQFDFALTSR